MNVYSYLNSKDVGQHLEQIGFELTATETARIIELCQHINLEEKHAAFRLLIEETSDEALTLPAECGREAKCTTLHRLLKEYMAAEEKMIQDFLRDGDGYIYNFQYTACFDGIQRTIKHDYLSCREIQKEFEHVPKYIESCDKITEFHATKINCITKDRTALILDGKGKPISVENLDIFWEPYTLLRFESGNRAFPSPFEKGDLVCGAENKIPFVFLEATWETVTGYFFTKTGIKKQKVLFFPFELEYFRDDFCHKTKALQAIGDFVKGKTELAEFVNFYCNSLIEGPHLKEKLFL